VGVKNIETSSAPIAPPPPDPTRDSGLLQADQFPQWSMPARVLGRKPGFQVVMRRSVVGDIRAHAKASPDVEICGVLVGDVYHDAEGPWCSVTANIRGNHASGRNAQVTFKAETWTDIHQQMEQRYPKQRILGWYHSHPGFGIFLSEMDVFIQHHFFSAPWQIAYVDDPKGGDRGLFVWRKGEPVREQHLVDEDVDAGPNDAPLSPEAAAQSDDQPFRESTRSFPIWFLITAAIVVVIGAIAFALWWLQ
jgi:proteasome lid subunit RPN8/RPN11